MMLVAYPKILRVVPESIADAIGIRPGFSLVAIDGQAIKDILDYRWAIANDSLLMTFLDDQDALWEIDIEKDYGEDIGIVFEHPTIIPLQRCQNNCIFCFVAQLPPGVRSTLCVKDDDYRLSSLHGSFVTLTNLTDDDWQRLLAMRPSPLYVSVHTTNGQLRAKMMGNPKAGLILEQLRTLAAANIEIHCQIVLVPGVNDGLELKRTVQDLLELWPAVQSVAIVPVGLTGHRSQLPVLRQTSMTEARAVIDLLLPLTQKMRQKLGVSFIYLADEFFLLAGSEVPERAYYDDFPQSENGIGLTRLLLDEVTPLLADLPTDLENQRRVIWVTGVAATPIMQALARKMNCVAGLWVDVLTVPNRFFGQSVTVAGLLAGQDILQALRAIEVDGAYVLVPQVALRQEENDFLDDMTFVELQQALPGACIIAAPSEGQTLIELTLGKEV